MVAGAVGFDNAAVGGLTAAVLLELALELQEQGRRIRFTSFQVDGGLAVGGASVLVWVPGWRPPTRPLGGARSGVGGRRSPRLAFVGGLGLVGVGDLHRAGRAQPDDDVAVGVLPGRADMGLDQRGGRCRVAAQRARAGGRPGRGHRRPLPRAR